MLKITYDNHMHSAFSGDSETPMPEMIEAAIKRGLSTITFTDHIDWDFKEQPGLFDLDYDAYIPAVKKYQKEYARDIEILLGVELGLQPHLAGRHREFLKTHEFDYIIGSSHIVHGVDPYYPKFFEGRSEREAYMEYFESVIENLEVFDDFDSYGHLDYVIRYGPNKDAEFSYKGYSDIIDEILKKLIGMDKALEINTGAFRCGLSHPNPHEDIVRRYLELGGKYITLGADAHRTEHIGLNYENLPGILADCGVREVAVFKNRRPVLYKL